MPDNLRCFSKISFYLVIVLPSNLFFMLIALMIILDFDETKHSVFRLYRFQRTGRFPIKIKFLKIGLDD